LCAVLHASPKTWSTGHERPGRYISHPDTASIKPEKANTQILCWLKTIKNGNALVIAATVAHNPNVTKIIGIAQQTKVPVVVNNVKIVTLLSLILDVCSAIQSSPV